MATSDDFRPEFVSQDDNLADLISRVAPEDRALHDSFGCVFTEAAFFNRRFLIVKTNGRVSNRPRPPDLLGSVRCTAYHCDHEAGPTITLMDDASSRILQVGCVPTKLFRFPIFASVPIYQGVKWEAKEMQDGSYRRNLVFGICFKQQSNIKFANRDNVSIVTPNGYRQFFGEAPPRF